MIYLIGLPTWFSVTQVTRYLSDLLPECYWFRAEGIPIIQVPFFLYLALPRSSLSTDLEMGRKGINEMNTRLRKGIRNKDLRCTPTILGLRVLMLEPARTTQPTSVISIEWDAVILPTQRKVGMLRLISGSKTLGRITILLLKVTKYTNPYPIIWQRRLPNCGVLY